MPKIEDHMIDLSRSNELHESLVNLALSFYAGEPCRLCQREITMDDLQGAARYVGYSEKYEGRSVHDECWSRFIELMLEYLSMKSKGTT